MNIETLTVNHCYGCRKCAYNTSPLRGNNTTVCSECNFRKELISSMRKEIQKDFADLIEYQNGLIAGLRIQLKEKNK